MESARPPVSLRRKIRQLTLQREERPVLLERALFLGTVPPADWVRDPKLLRLLLRIRPYTMLPYRRLRAFADAVATMRRESVPGHFVQCGVWQGGSAGLVGRLFEDNAMRHLWLFDSWEGQPPPSEADVAYLDRSRGRPGMFATPEATARRLLLEELRLDPARIHLVKGWFDRTISAHAEAIGRIGLLHVDCDFYEPVRLCLDALVPRVVPGGFVFVDDYGEWEGAHRATDEFLAGRSPRPELVPVDEAAVYFRVPRGGGVGAGGLRVPRAATDTEPFGES
jgi:O-methyltransferase